MRCLAVKDIKSPPKIKMTASHDGHEDERRQVIPDKRQILGSHVGGVASVLALQ